MELKEQEKYLIIASNEYKSMFYSYKERHPYLDFKVINKSELCDVLCFTFQKDPIPFLLKDEKWDYSQCKKIMNILRIGDYPSGKFKDLYNKLELNDCIKKDVIGKRRFKDRKVLVFENEEDFELIELLKRNDVSYDTLSFADLGVDSNFDSNKQFIYDFDDKMQQYFYLFSDIKAKILSNENVKNHITIFTDFDTDFFYLNLFMYLFQIECYIKIKTSFKALTSVESALNMFYKNKNFTLDVIPKEKTSLSLLMELINRYGLNTLPFDFAYSNLVEIANGLKTVGEITDRGIPLTDKINFDHVFDDDSLTYILTFQHDVFYKEYADDNVISDSELEKIKVNPSYVKTKIDRRLKLNYLKYNHIVLLSKVLKHQSDQINSSQFISELKLKNYVKKMSGINNNGVYTNRAKDILLCIEKDKNFDTFNPDDHKNYKAYNPKFKKFEFSSFKNEFYVTELDEFYQCPFKYYLNHVLKVDEGHDFSIHAAIGEMLHSIFEDIYTRNYSSFDNAYKEVFEKGKQTFINEAIKKNHEINDEDKLVIKLIEKWLPYILKNEIEHKNQYSNIKNEVHEQTITYTVSDKDKTYKLKGRVDKIVYSKGESGSNYYTIIDYKSGSSGSFDITHCFLGGSLQLPIYYLATKQQANAELTHNFTDEFGGFGIQKIYFKNVPLKDRQKFCIESIQEHTKLNGLAYNSMDYFDSYDKTVTYDDKGNLVNGNFIDTSHIFSLDADSSIKISKDKSYKFDDFIKDVNNAILNSIHRIRNGDFDISPMVCNPNNDIERSDSPCKYCSFKDICYSANKNTRDGKKEIEEHFKIKINSNAEEDE